MKPVRGCCPDSVQMFREGGCGRGLDSVMLSFPQVLRVAEMLWRRGAQAPHSVVGASREEGPEVPSKCHQQPEVQLLHLSSWGTYSWGHF